MRRMARAHRADRRVRAECGNGWQFFKSLTENDYWREPWIPRDGLIQNRPELIGERYILFPHAVEESEFVSVANGMRRVDASVLGVGYHTRRQAIEFLERSGRFRYVSRKNLVQRLLGLYAHKSAFLRRTYQARFNRFLDNSLTSITCAGTVGYPIRKFFEIPAHGCVLIAEFFERAEALGFRNLENCFAIDGEKVDGIHEILDFLKSDAVEARRIAGAGQQMVRDCHTIPVRVANLYAIAAAVADGSLKTVIWEDGRMRLVKNGDDAVANANKGVQCEPSSAGEKS